MKPLAPNSNITTMQILLNFYRVLTGNIGFGNFTSPLDSIGVPITYSQDNVNNCMIRVGALASTGIAQKWTASHSNVILNHTLGQIPIGYIVFRKSGPVDVYTGTVPWTDKTICLQTTDDTQDTHIMIF